MSRAVDAAATSAPESPTESKAAKWTAHHRENLYPEWEIEEAVNVKSANGTRVLAEIVATVHGEGDIARERAELFVAARETKRQRDMLLEALKRATSELNAIRARDGAPQHIDWHRGQPLQTSSCTEEYWDALTEECFAAISACEESGQ